MEELLYKLDELLGELAELDRVRLCWARTVETLA